MTTIPTRQQQMAQNAYAAVSSHPQSDKDSKEYASFAKSLPALIQSAGLCQAVAFAQKGGEGGGPRTKVLADVVTAMNLPDMTTPGQLASRARTDSVLGYLRISRVALQAAGWVKRYVESLE